MEKEIRAIQVKEKINYGLARKQFMIKNPLSTRNFANLLKIPNEAKNKPPDRRMLIRGRKTTENSDDDDAKDLTEAEKIAERKRNANTPPMNPPKKKKEDQAKTRNDQNETSKS